MRRRSKRQEGSLQKKDREKEEGWNCLIEEEINKAQDAVKQRPEAEGGGKNEDQGRAGQKKGKGKGKGCLFGGLRGIGRQGRKEKTIG